MRKHFAPEVVRDWTEDDLRQLVGKYVVVEVAASEWYKENIPDGGDWEGGTGLCTQAEIITRSIAGKRTELFDVIWDYGMGWSWEPSTEAHVHVCDEHGEHRVKWNHNRQRYEDNGDEGAAECLSTLGVRGRKEVAGGEGEEAAEGSPNTED